MRVHHLNTGTMCPLSARLVNGRGGWFERARMVCHVLLVERRDGLLLVDTGLGMGDIADPVRLGRRWLKMTAPRLDPVETALAQVKALGLSPDDVRDIAVTHLDLDHAGGVPDFPRATVHVHRREQQAALAAAGARGRFRYIPGHWAHGPRWQLHDDGGERWFGFDGVRALDRDGDVLMVPLPGHTSGHCGVAVRTPERWLLHAGDGYLFHGQIDSPAHAPWALRLFQRRSDTDRARRIANQERLRALRAEHGGEVTIFCAHDAVEFERARGTGTGAPAGTLRSVAPGRDRSSDRGG